MRSSLGTKLLITKVGLLLHSGAPSLSRPLQRTIRACLYRASQLNRLAPT